MQAGPSTSFQPRVKRELSEQSNKGDKKRWKSETPRPSGTPGSSVPVALRNKPAPVHDPRTAALDLRGHLKQVRSMNWSDAFFQCQSRYPDMHTDTVLDLLKGLERVRFNEANLVFEYIPELTLPNLQALSSHIRTHSTPTTGLAAKPLREAVPPPLNANVMLEQLESSGSVLLMRSLGPFKEAALPPLGRKNVYGLGVNDSDEGRAPGYRIRSVFWDDIKERGRAGTRVDDEIITLWADVPIAETDDVSKLLADQELSASSVVPPPAKITPTGPVKKKGRTRRVLRITNTHMKAQGIDFSRDYERPS